MRRTLATAPVLAALALVLTGCGDDSSEASNASVSLAGSESSTSQPEASPAVSSPATSAASPAVTERATPQSTTARRGVPPAGRVEPGAIVSGEGFLRSGSGTDYQFTAGGGRWKCVVTQTVAGCTGALAQGAPAGSDGVAVTSDAKSAFGDGTGADLAPRGAAKELPPGRSLPNGVFVCTAFDAGVQCETASGTAGFQVTEQENLLW